MIGRATSNMRVLFDAHMKLAPRLRNGLQYYGGVYKRKLWVV